MIEPLLWKVWLTALQFLDDFSAQDVIAAIGERWAYVLATMSPVQRYSTFAGACQFQASGLSSTLARGKDLAEAPGVCRPRDTRSPFLAQTFLENYSAKKYLDRILQAMNIDPEGIELTPEERVEQQVKFQQSQQMQAGQGQTGATIPSDGVPGVSPGGGGGRAIEGIAMPRESMGRRAGASPRAECPTGASTKCATAGAGSTSIDTARV